MGPHRHPGDAVRVVRDALVTVRPLVPGDYPAVHRLEAHPAGTGARLPHDLDDAALAQALWNGVLAQSTVRTTVADRLVGLVTCYDADLRNGHAWLAARTAPERIGSGLALLGLGHLITDLLRDWPLRTLYAETAPDLVADLTVALGAVARVEGVLQGYRLRDGVPADRLVLAIDAEAWLAGPGARLLRRRALSAPATVTLAAS